MNTSNQSYKELAIPYFKEVFEIIDQIMKAHQVPYYLIGVSALAIELLKQGVRPSRGTKDIDFAIMISSLKEYESISKSLNKVGFAKSNAPWTFFSAKYHVAIDLLPFGEIEENDTISFNQRYSDLYVLGFREVLEDSTEALIEEKVVNIPPLPGMVILKLVAWSDRPEERDDDLGDILNIIQHYFEYAYDEIVEHHNDLFADKAEFDQIAIASEVLGRKARVYLNKSERLSNRVFKVLEENLTYSAKSEIAKDWARKLDREIEHAFGILEAFHRGLMFESGNY